MVGMGLDINLFRADKGNDPNVVRESQRRRYQPVEIVDEIIALDNDWKKARFDADEINKEINAVQKKIGALMKEKKKAEAEDLLKEKDRFTAEKGALEKKVAEKEAILNRKLNSLGNLVHDTVIVSDTEDDNGLVKTWWPEGQTEADEKLRRMKLVAGEGVPAAAKEKGVPGLLPHHEIMDKLGMYDQARGTKIAGHRGFFLTGPGVDLNFALMQYGLDFLEDRGYTKLWTPFFMNKDIMGKTAQLEEFDEALYKVQGELGPNGEEVEGSTSYLIATSEQPISAMHMGEWLEEKELPKKYAGTSTCFRKEAGAHGRDNWGIFRVHQFEKVEQFVLTDPEKSWEMHDEMLKAAEEFYQSLGFPYRVVNIVSKALNNAAAKKYDLEAWFPFQGTYKELVSCSNCTDYQTRALDIRFGAKKLNETTKRYAHALNCTLTATERTLCCLVENYQKEDGIEIPVVLRPYMRNKSFIPFRKEEVKAKPEGKGKK
ncbi:Cytosolic seryl-tRNA synthetase [Irineochytrium annulatum]|nr:Cytosolic seryl-tRNA synthetase [Irineochytrium annulatum]